jgi:hypothetical protein
MHMNRKSILELLGALLLVLVLLSCTNPDLDPIFYALEQAESLVDDRGFPDEAVVQRIVRDSGSGRYFAAAGMLYTRTTGNWKMIAGPESRALCTNIEIFDPGTGALLLAAYMRADNTGLGLWQRSVSGGSWSRANGGDLAANVNIGVLKNVSGTLFVSTLEGSTYHLYYTTQLTFPVFSDTGLTATMASGPINDVALDGLGNYWVSVGKTLWSGTSPAFIFTQDALSTTSGYLKGLYYSSATTTLYLAGFGHFYKKIDGGGWTASSRVTDDDNNNIQFTCFAELSALFGGDIYAGTKLNGYYFTDTLKRAPHETITALYDGGILSMLFDGSSLFLGTYGSGLWRRSYQAGETDEEKLKNWKQE